MTVQTPTAPAADDAQGVATPKRPFKERLADWKPSNVTQGGPVFPLFVLFGLNLVDELDREAFNLLIPEIRTHFDLDIQGILTLTSVVGFFVLFLEIPLAQLADRRSRTRIAAGGAATWGVASFLTAIAGYLSNIWMLGAVRGAANLGRAVTGATHRPLIADYYPVDVRPAAFAVHSAANSIGQFAGPLMAASLVYYFSWQTPFMVFALPTFVFVVLALRLKDPIRGFHERTVHGADAVTAATEEKPASMAEAWRIAW
ncbi:MAG: MFS transporter, partial [Acidimicrobiia bacterium]|nr:MFS transporter [Acidimicrobiia bacterium]